MSGLISKSSPPGGTFIPPSSAHQPSDSQRSVTRGSATHPQPSSQFTGLLGLCSQSLRCDCSWSRRSVAVQPKPALSQPICSLDSMLRIMRGTGRRWASVTTVRSTGQICCCANHCVMQALQKACSQCGACGAVPSQRRQGS